MTATAPAEPAVGDAGIRVDVHGSIAHVTLSRPHIHNAVSHAMLDELVALLSELEGRKTVKVVVLAGEGPSFCSGFELTRSSDAISAIALDAEADQRRIAGYLDVVLALVETPLIVIGAVQGHCMGIGVLLAAGCDLLVVEEDATLAMPAIPIGACFISTVLGTLVGVKRAKRMSLIPGGSINGTTALEWGLATDAVPAGDALATADELASQVARMPAAVLRLEKRGLNRVLEEQGLRRALEAAADLDAIAHASDEVHALKATIQRVGLKAAMAELR